MNADHLLALYDRVADAPDAVSRLRRFVLDLAVRGKLVEQDPADEPAAELVKQIAVERARAPKSKKRKPSLINTGTFGSNLFGLPTGWEWVPLAGISDVTMGQSPPGDTYNKSCDGVPLINGPVEFTPEPFGRTVVNQFTTAPTNFCEEGDLLICVRGSTTGRTNVAGFRACIGRGVAAIRSSFDDEFIRLFLWKAREDIISMGRGIAFPSISKKQLENLAIPLPPLAEQRRIVAKIDELMALCDRVEEARTAREKTRDRLTTASLARLSAPDTDAVTFRSHARFAVNSLSALTARADQVKHFRQTILTLAVRGKLVEQNPADEPASGLLKRIAAEKSRLVSAKKIKRSEVVPILPEEYPFEIPDNWVWTRLGTIGDWGAGSTPPRGNSDLYGGGVTWLKSGELNDNIALAGSKEKVTEIAVQKGSFRTNQPGDVLIAMYGATIGKLAILAEVAVTNQAVCGCTPLAGVSNHYLFLFLLFQRQQFQRSSEGGAQPNISKIKIVSTPFPLPPLAEQHRIVAKIDELMTLYDRLESSVAASGATRSRLLEALLHEALGPTDSRVTGDAASPL